MCNDIGNPKGLVSFILNCLKTIKDYFKSFLNSPCVVHVFLTMLALFSRLSNLMQSLV